MTQKKLTPAELRVKARAGDPAAQYQIALLLEDGEGVRRDRRAGLRWLTKAAEAGHAEAQYELAGWYDCGIGVKQCHRVAARWYRAAAEQGHVAAQ